MPPPPIGRPVSALTEERAGLFEGVRSAAWRTTRLTVIKPLMAAAPVAKAATAATLETLVRLLPEHVAAEVAVALGALAAKATCLLCETPEGIACVRAAEHVACEAVDCASSAQCEQFAKEAADAALRLAKALKSPQATDFFDSCERAAHAALRVAGSQEAARVVSAVRGAIEATVDLAASDATRGTVEEAVVSVGIALRDHRGRDTLVAEPLVESEPLVENDTLSEVDSDSTPRPYFARTVPKPKRTTAATFCLVCIFGAILAWVGFTLLGLAVALHWSTSTLLRPAHPPSSADEF